MNHPIIRNTFSFKTCFEKLLSISELLKSLKIIINEVSVFASSAWILDAADDPFGSWELLGQGAIVFEGSSTRAELLAACLLHCAFAECIGVRVPCPELWSLQMAAFPNK